MMETFKDCNSAQDLNAKLITDIFFDDECVKDLNLVEHWKIDTTDGIEYIKQHGKHVMKLALAKYVEMQDKIKYCMLVNDRMHTPFGITVADPTDHSTLVSIASAESLSNEMLSDAVAQRVLTPACMTYFAAEDAKSEPTRKRKKT